MQQVFRTVEFEAGTVLKNCFVWVSGGGDNEEQLGIAKVFLLFRMYKGAKGIDEKFAFLQYMKGTTALDDKDETFGCVCLRWIIDDLMDPAPGTTAHKT